MQPVSLYIHIPFCTSKCHYCSFNSVTGKGGWISRYVAALIQEMVYYQPRLKGKKVRTLFFGGGTPSLLSGEEVERLIREIQSRFEWEPNAECSLEANPGTLSLEKLKHYKQAGVNRVSVGAQSFQLAELKWLGRTHPVEAIFESVKNIREAGFDNFNLDLIFGLPGQLLQHWQENVRQALALEPTHIALYHLTIEEGSTFGDIKQLASPCDKEGAKLFNWTRGALEKAGFEHYEISNYARPGFRCKHNEVYWRNKDSVGIGAGAWTYLNGERYCRPKTIEAYIQDVEEKKFQRLDKEALVSPRAMRETLVFGLRTHEGVHLRQLQRRYELLLEEETKRAIQNLIDQNLLTLENETLRLTDKGFLFADSVAVELI